MPFESLTQQISGNVIKADDWNKTLNEVSKLQEKFAVTATGHRHTGGVEDGPQITSAGIADGAITAAKIAAGVLSSEIGIAFKSDMNNGEDIPIPTGFVKAECVFFAAITAYVRSSGGGGGTSFGGRVEVADGRIVISASGQITVLALGVALAKKGGW